MQEILPSHWRLVKFPNGAVARWLESELYLVWSAPPMPWPDTHEVLGAKR